MGSGDFGDLAARMAAARKKQKAGEKPDKPFDYAESYRLRAKMLGVLIRDARVAAARTLEDCARLLHVTTDVIEAWEFGDIAPDLPQLELLAYYLDVPVSHFWGQQTRESDPTQKVRAQTEYVQLRQRMIGALLRQAREERPLTLQEVAEATQISEATLTQYEAGEVPIPMHELSVLSNIVNKNMDYFLESSSYIGTLLQIREEWKRFVELDEDIRRFVANPRHLAFIKIAMTFGNMPVEELRKAAEGMLDISM